MTATEERYNQQWHRDYEARHTRNGALPGITPLRTRNTYYYDGACRLSGVPLEPPLEWGLRHRNMVCYWDELRSQCDRDYASMRGQTVLPFTWPKSESDWRFLFYGPQPMQKAPPERGAVLEPDYQAMEAKLREVHARAKTELARLFPTG
jgi:hypothetical protein